MKISIILPIYNAEKYLKQCLDALLNQTYTNIEILCINDGSQDQGLHILESYAQKDSRIKIHDQPNSGPATARNRGLTAATGQYIMFCDADDCYAPQMCEAMLGAITSTNVDLVMCDCELVECPDDPDPQRPPETDCFLTLFGYYQLTNDAMVEVKGLLWNKIFKKDIIDQYAITFPDGFEHDDVTFVEQYVCCARHLFGLDQKLYSHLIHANSIMGRTFGNDPKILETLDAIKHTFFFLQKNQLFTERNFYHYAKLLYYRLVWTYEKCTAPENKTLAIEKARTILIHFDLDLYYQDHFVEKLKKIKQKNYDEFLEEMQRSAIPDTDTGMCTNTAPASKKLDRKCILNIIKAYLP